MMVARGGVAACLVWLLSSAGATTARADIFLHRDADGVVHLTNAPAGSMAHRVLRERPRMVLQVPEASALPPPRLPKMPDSNAYDDLVRDACERYGVEFELVKALIRAESAFDPLAISRAGARGLMQLMPETARMHGVGNSFLPHENIEGGVQHLRLLLDRYGGNVTLALAAYNAGATRVDEAGGIPNIRETQEYVPRVLRFRAQYRRGRPGDVTAGR